MRLARWLMERARRARARERAAPRVYFPGTVRPSVGERPVETLRRAEDLEAHFGEVRLEMPPPPPWVLEAARSSSTPHLVRPSLEDFPEAPPEE